MNNDHNLVKRRKFYKKRRRSHNQRRQQKKEHRVVDQNPQTTQPFPSEHKKDNRVTVSRETTVDQLESDVLKCNCFTQNEQRLCHSKKKNAIRISNTIITQYIIR